MERQNEYVALQWLTKTVRKLFCGAGIAGRVPSTRIRRLLAHYGGRHLYTVAFARSFTFPSCTSTAYSTF
jgi:hypothetical protein